MKEAFFVLCLLAVLVTNSTANSNSPTSPPSMTFLSSAPEAAQSLSPTQEPSMILSLAPSTSTVMPSLMSSSPTLQPSIKSSFPTENIFKPTVEPSLAQSKSTVAPSQRTSTPTYSAVTKRMIMQEGLACFAIAAAIPKLKNLKDLSPGKTSWVANASWSEIEPVLDHNMDISTMLDEDENESEIGINRKEITNENISNNFLKNILQNVPTNIPRNKAEEYFENIAESVLSNDFSTQPPWCSFEGIFCGTFLGTLNYSSVLKISISMKNLTGTIPEEIAYLQNLQFIDFSSNLLNGTIPSNLNKWSKNLMNLNLSTNSLSGNISYLPSLNKLANLSISRNLLNGEIPQGINLLSSLTLLDLSFNFLIGTLPVTLGQNTKLQNLQISNNLIFGQIPISFTNLTNLEYLSIGTNALTGKIPNLITNMKKLKLLNLELNSLSGTIPSKISKLSLLSTVTFQSNFLTMGLKKSINSTLFSTATNEGTLQLFENCLVFKSFYKSEQNCNATRCQQPTSSPSSSPTGQAETQYPTMTNSPTSNPSPKPSVQLLSRSPTISRKPTLPPTVPPSGPTAVPTQKPSKPTSLPSFKPTGPTSIPTVKPSKVTESPTQILTGYPVNPVDSTDVPTMSPTTYDDSLQAKQIIKGFGLNNLTPAKSLKLKMSLNKVISEYVSYYRLNVTLENYTVEVVYANVTALNTKKLNDENGFENNNEKKSTIKTSSNIINRCITYFEFKYIDYPKNKNVGNITQPEIYLNVEYSVRMPIKATALIIQRLNYAITDTLFSRRLSLYYGETLVVSGLFYQEYKITKNPSRPSSEKENKKKSLTEKEKLTYGLAGGFSALVIIGGIIFLTFYCAKKRNWYKL